MFVPFVSVAYNSDLIFNIVNSRFSGSGLTMVKKIIPNKKLKFCSTVPATYCNLLAVFRQAIYVMFCVSKLLYLYYFYILDDVCRTENVFLNTVCNFK
jgi:hypothetical protein